MKKELKVKWRKFIEDNPKYTKTIGVHHFVRTRYASRFWLKIIKEFINGERCLHCGDYKTTDRPDLTDTCYKCLEEL